MSTRGLVLLIAFAGLVGIACSSSGVSADVPGDESTPDADLQPSSQDGIEPGMGVTLGGVAIHLMGSAVDVEAALGAPARVLAVAPGAARLEWLDVGLVLLADGETRDILGIELVAPFAGTTADGVGIGSARAAVDALAFDFVREPFLGASLDRARGLGLLWEADRVVRVTLSWPRS